jgi:hypothetical protein
LLWGEYYDQFVEEGESSMEPISDFSFPIVDDISRVSAFEDQENTALGIVVATLYWRSMLR